MIRAVGTVHAVLDTSIVTAEFIRIEDELHKATGAVHVSSKEQERHSFRNFERLQPRSRTTRIRSQDA